MSTIEQQIREIAQNGVCVNQDVHLFPVTGVDFVFPHIVVMICLRGTARATYDMQEYVLQPNTVGIVMPGHMLRALSCSEDFTYARMEISAAMFKDLKAYAFTHDYDKFNFAPVCQLSDLQAKRILAHLELIEAIAAHPLKDLQFRQQMLLSQLAIAYEFINYYRREQDKLQEKNRYAAVFQQFCDLVVAHYTENRNINFYAEKIGYESRYFSKIFRESSQGISPLVWIQQYVASQAKQIMDMNPKQTIKETAFQLGFPTTANFCRYFKRATGIYPQTYKKNKTYMN